MHAGFLQLPRPLDVVGLVEPRAQLHHRRDLLAVVHRVHQRADDARVAAGAVERLLDGEHVRVLRRSFEKFHHAVEIFVGMMQQHIALADGGEHIRASAQRRADRRDERRVAQVPANGRPHKAPSAASDSAGR